MDKSPGRKERAGLYTGLSRAHIANHAKAHSYAIYVILRVDETNEVRSDRKWMREYMGGDKKLSEYEK